MTTYEPATGTWMTPHGHAVTLEYRLDTNDSNTISSCMGPNDEYGIPSGLRGCALDIGAYLGSVTIALLMDNPDLYVTAVEPVPDNVRLIRRNLELNGCADRCTVIEGAVGGPLDGPVTVWYGYSGNESAEHHAFVGNSSLAYDHGGFLPHKSVTYEPWFFSQLNQNFYPIRWAKIDAEGAEWEFLKDPAVEQVDYWVGEWHPVRGHVRADLIPLLGKTHDLTFSVPDGVDPEHGPGQFTATKR